ncbi:hypothetical protein [Streptomyces sp. NPDC051183]|uniref:hypothetical protein n=1 Tax=unclassified Streptomyces TaxID=2593676 RepID=UPI00343CF163
MSHPSRHGSRVSPRRRHRLVAQLAAGCIAAGSLVSATAPATAAGSVNADAYYSLKPAPLRQDWMKSMDGGTSLARVSLPGTHDTLAGRLPELIPSAQRARTCLAGVRARC